MATATKEKSPHLKRFHYTLDVAVDKPFNWKQMLRLLQFLKPYAKTVLPIAIIAMLVSTAVRLIVPILIGRVAIDIAVANQDVNLLIQLVVGISILYLLSYIGNAVRIKYVTF